MAKFRKKPVVIEATQWFKMGDHSEVISYPEEAIEHRILPACEFCHAPLYDHGWVKTLEGGHIVCPGDWIIKGTLGEFYPCKPAAFENSYEKEEA